TPNSAWNFRTFSTTTARGPVGTARSNKHLPVLATNRCKLRILEPRRNELSGIPNRRKSMFRAFFGRRGGYRRSPVHTHAASRALLRPHFSYFLCHNSDFGRSGRCVLRGRIRFGSSQNPGCGAVRSDAVARRSLRGFTD